MNNYELKLYDDLLRLSNTNEAFYYVDHVLDDITYRVFSYRLASYQDFQEDNALESRGTMFSLSNELLPSLAALPMQKFWNVNENPNTMNLDFTKIKQCMLKMDGSLISTFIHKGKLRLKSKTSLFSDHAINAMKWLDKPENLNYKNELTLLTKSEYTVNLEYTSPEPKMRIVIGYQEPTLTVLNIRDTRNGSYLNIEALVAFEEIQKHYVEVIPIENGEEFVESISDKVGIEGYVIQLESGQLVKKKTNWYVSLHHSKDSINSPRRLFECVLDEATDDLRSMFSDDQYAISAITEMEERVNHLYNSLVNNVESFYSENKDLDRKEFAIKAKNSLDQREFALVMLKYSGKDFLYKDFMKKWYKEFGIDDK